MRFLASEVRLGSIFRLRAASSARQKSFRNLTESLHSYVRFTVQHVGTSFTQLADQEAGFGTILRPSLQQPNDGTASLIDLGDVDVDRIDFDAELKAYDIGNLRWGWGTDAWEAGVFVNDRPRARSPRARR